MIALLIDTKIYSYAMRGGAEITKTLQQIAPIGICAISIGELLSGFKAGNKEKTNRQELNQFLDSPRVTLYGIDEGTAEFYCLILDQLKIMARPSQPTTSGLPQPLFNKACQSIQKISTSIRLKSC